MEGRPGVRLGSAPGTHLPQLGEGSGHVYLMGLQLGLRAAEVLGFLGHLISGLVGST